MIAIIRTKLDSRRGQDYSQLTLPFPGLPVKLLQPYLLEMCPH